LQQLATCGQSDKEVSHGTHVNESCLTFE